MLNKTKSSKKLRIRKQPLLVFASLIFLAILVFLQFTKMASVKEEGLRVDFNSELSYTLTITYDGVDRNGDVSFDSSGKPRIVKIESGYIYVEDVLPDGLIFQKFNFEGNDNVVIGSEKQDETSTGTCKGYVVNDSKGSTDPNSNHGLHYDPTTRKVTFKIKNLSAGCKIDVGIVTKTPETIEGERKDFYNTATAWEGSQVAYSNMVHAYLQKKNGTVSTNKVTYQFTGIVPSGVTPPLEQEYAPNVIVGIANNPTIEGYTFSGWQVMEPLGLDTTGNKFTMPNSNVVLQGSFTENTKYNVTYRIEGEGPSSYILPTNKQYYENAMVKVDSMSAGDTFNGYKFLGWTIDGIEIIEGTDKEEGKYFQMPAKDVEVVGKWEQIKYKVTYDFYDGAKPSNYQDILNTINSQDNTYVPGNSVTLPNVEDVSGYHFQGWYESDGFTMPEHDVTVYGEWIERNGVFTPTITKEIVNKKDYYRIGDEVSYNIVVSNIASYPIKNVQVRENNEKAYFIDDGSSNYQVRSNHMAEIATIPVGGSVTIKALYPVSEDDVGTTTNEVEILGALADNSYELDTTKKYKASASFKVQAKLKICKITKDDKTDQVYQFHMTSTDKEFETWINLANNECETMYVDSKEYQITEILPQSYELDNIVYSSNLSGVRENNTTTFTIGNEANYEITFNNKYLKKGYYHSNVRMINRVESSVIPLEATKTVTNLPARGYFRVGEEATFDIAISNTSNQKVTDISVEEILEGASFVESTNNEYTIENNIAKIDELDIDQSVILKVKYTISRVNLLNRYVKNEILISAKTRNGQAEHSFTIDSGEIPVGSSSESGGGGGGGGGGGTVVIDPDNP